jgi:hypothetical protein
MFDVYVNERRELLVVRKGCPIPVGEVSGRWRKLKKKAARVSDDIRLAVQSRGYYMRKLRIPKIGKAGPWGGLRC